MTTPRQEPMQLADHVRELTHPHTHREHYTHRRGGTWYGQDHLVEAPALITQLWANDTPSAAADDGPRAGYTSKPAARLDALDTAVRIDLAAARWIRDLGEDDHHTDTAATIRQLHGLAASAPRCTRSRGVGGCCTRHAIEHDVRRWWLQARIVTGWDSPAWRPDNTCPMCGERGTLSVRLAEHIAMCANDPCRTTWDEHSIGLLADHIRIESQEARKPKTGPGSCWCPWPKPIVADLSRLCPRCGSARCRHALGARLVDTVTASA